MNESLHTYMRVGIIHFMAYPEAGSGQGAIDETVRKIAMDDYFDAIEITWIKDDKVREKVRQLLASAHIDTAFGAQPMLLSQKQNVNSLDEGERKKAVDTVKAAIDEAYAVGAEGAAFLSGKYEEASKEEAFQALLKSTREICAYAKSKGDMKIVHEVFDYDVDKASLIGPASLAKRYAEEIKAEYDNFGLMVDLSHIPLLHETIKESLLPIKEHLVHAHMGNCVMKDPSMPAYGDQHPRFGFPNSENDVDELAEYLQALKDMGFLNKKKPPILSFEVKPTAGEDPDVVIAGSKRVLNRAWALVK
ncbi:TIM barrel protein [Marispirochaeta sp.]|jgi:sugar phosphate isomerase/epimerase|uniref:sugar phosphate isomerase/epimerase family protein n=1 Tax=Marispirochaeta sp. TaxID=2038653 RepID=UPI0029C8BFD5|nr:TIM barrel protein [Marispirochaeta sp.]